MRKYLMLVVCLLFFGLSTLQPTDILERLDPKIAIAQQLELLKAGDITKLKKHFTERLQDLITEELVAEAKKEAVRYTIDDLVVSAEYGESQGKETVKLKMKNGRTLTTLILVNNIWLADTIWFK